MKVFAVCGIKNSGKTTTVENIIGELVARGYRVGSAKYIHCDGFEMDPDPATDTRRHKDAGSRLVAAHAKQETSILFPQRIPTEKLITFYEGMCDWVVLEGVSDIAVPTIITAHGEQDLLSKWSDMVFCVSGRISSSIWQYCGIPAIDSVKNVELLVDYLEDRVYDYSLNTNCIRYLVNSLQRPTHAMRRLA